MNPRKEARVARAMVRYAEREKRTAQEQFDRLDELLGKGMGAKKERARLLREINK